MDILQKRMEELQRQYMKEKENLRYELYSTLLSARKMAQEQELASQNEMSEPEFGLSPQLAQLQQEKQRIQNQIDEHIRQQQQVKQQQMRFNQMQANTERDLQQQRLLQHQQDPAWSSCQGMLWKNHSKQAQKRQGKTKPGSGEEMERDLLHKIETKENS